MPNNKSQQLLIIATVWPEPESSAAGRRMMQLITLFQDNGWKITVASASKKNSFSADLEHLHINTANIKINSSSFDAFIQNLKPDVVLFDRFMIEEQFGWRVATHCPDAIRILDTEDLHCLRKSRREAVQSGQSFKPHDLLQSDIAKREIASILRCDLSLIISEFEMNLLKQLFKVDSSLLYYVPFLLSPIDEAVTNSWLPFNERNHFVTVGNFRHAPNWDAILYLKNNIWPRIHERLPKAEMHIYGAYPSPQAETLHQPTQKFYIEGRTKDAKAVVSRARVCLAPLRFGAGLKGKLIETMQCGTPSITTDIGAEGLNGDLEWSGAVANQPEEFAAAAVELYLNKERWKIAQENGVKIINSRFMKEKFGPALMNRILEIQHNLDEHRGQNFTGAMLMHHSMVSTKYMSRWIEEKNKR